MVLQAEQQDTEDTRGIIFLPSEIESSITKRFQFIARSVPNHTAVDSLTENLTYAQLDALSDQVACAIASRPHSIGKKPVAVWTGQGHLAMAGILGVLKTSAGVVAFPPDSPLEQLRYLWEDALHPLVLTSRSFSERAREIVSSDNELLVIDDLPPIKNGMRPEFDEVVPGNLAVISYTSGSTGDPKGVLWSHRLILHTAFQNQLSYRLVPQDRSAVLASFGYGAAMTQCFAALLSGATLYLPDLRVSNISTLLEWLRAEQITVLAMPPFGLFRQMMEELSAGDGLPQLRLVILGGDDLFQKDVDRFWTCFSPHTELAFRLAGSETMVMREIIITPGMKFSTEKIPVGYAVPDKKVSLVDENGSEVPPGEIGEIVVSSPYLASGYWQQPDLTNDHFKSDPANRGGRIYFTGDLARINTSGQMEHLGRKDHMVKIRGFSVHLEAIDKALTNLPDVLEAVTLADHLAGGGKRLVAYLVPKDVNKPSVTEIHKILHDHLPEHMIPSVFVWLNELPRTKTGKIDRKSLPAPARVRPELKNQLVLPRNELEESLAHVWKDLLQLDQVGVEDNFFELGGDSLLSVQMILSAEKILKCKIPSAYFRQPTINCLVEISKQESLVGGLQPLPGISQEDQVVRHLRTKRTSKYSRKFRRLVQGRMQVNAALWSLQKELGSLVRLFWKRTKIREILQLPYAKGLQEVCHLSEQGLAVPGPFRGTYKVFRRFINELDGCTADLDTVFAASMTGYTMSWLRFGNISGDLSVQLIDRLRNSPYPFWSSMVEMIDHAPLEELDRFFSVSGLEYLQQASRKGSGVIILTYHSVSNQLAIVALPRRLNGEFIPTISPKIVKQQNPLWDKYDPDEIPAVDKAAMFSEIALHGQHLLEKGKIIQFVSDTEFDKEGYPVILAGRRYYLKTGFAELAINSGAQVVPQYTTQRVDGHIHTTFLPPFIVGDGDRESKIKSLVDQYVIFVNTCWKIAPETLGGRKILRHFRQPLT